MKISILLPYKENFSPNYAGAVSLFVNDITKKSIYNKQTYIFGNMHYTKTLSKHYINLELRKKFYQSTSKEYVQTLINNNNFWNSDILEIHNRPNYVKYIKKEFKNKIILYFHNDPLTMSGSKSKNDRLYLLNSIDKIIFNSNWSKNRFFSDLPNK